LGIKNTEKIRERQQFDRQDENMDILFVEPYCNTTGEVFQYRQKGIKKAPDGDIDTSRAF